MDAWCAGQKGHVGVGGEYGGRSYYRDQNFHYDSWEMGCMGFEEAEGTNNSPTRGKRGKPYLGLRESEGGPNSKDVGLGV